MENKVNTLTKNLQELGYIVTVFDKIESASEYLNSKIDNTSVGFAGSQTLEKSGLYDMLKTHNEVYWHHRIPEGKTSKDVRMQARDTKVYLTSVNAISIAGEIVNIDANCNRVAEIFYGHDKVYFVIGTNKIEDDYDKALYRARNIAAPKNAKRLGVNTPCAIKADRCYNCKSPQRICRGLSVLWSKPMTGEFEIVLVKEELGY